MKSVIAFIGSPRENSNSKLMAQEAIKGASSAGAITKTYILNQLNFKGCQGCYYCRTHENCVLRDDLTPIIEELKKASAVIIASPLYMWGVTGQTKLFLDRLLPLIGDHFKPKYSLKKTLMIYSQGNPKPVKFGNYFKEMKKLLKVMGLVVSKEIIAVKADKPGIVAGTILIEKAFLSGKELME